jgi:hypothetical protein
MAQRTLSAFAAARVRAMAHCRVAIRVQPGSWQTYGELAQLLASINQSNEAIRVAETHHADRFCRISISLCRGLYGRLVVEVLARKLANCLVGLNCLKWIMARCEEPWTISINGSAQSSNS